ncbi:AAA+-type ATPase, SpoVK/Ycf46/Vps4 family [Fodinibius salinus]|uniref:AAA+-type ATPase, SpoVK/Ycf46/Vps4 family n=1 Tax=Fodinibius salinus TaxID=860790 RepID=A0A5D3YGE5_9BACT|nr:AAA family ATPase [Fodinibius salinus]TYP92622.1 AAA+-type ATPase, SpoVK/Ycf46/Vps4 family [Fodinibius salinus]
MFNHYPDWAQQLAQKYLSRTINQFILHGNVHDLVPLNKEGETDFVRLKEFFSKEFFGARDYVIFYDRSSGIYFRDQETQKDFNRALSGRDSLLGTDYADNLPKDPVRVFSLLEQYFRVRFDNKKSIALVIDYAETIVPMNEAGSTGSEDRTAMVYLSRWAQDPMFLAADFTTILLTENLADLNKTLVQHPYVNEITIPIPDQQERSAFIEFETSADVFSDISEVPQKVVAQQTAGLNFINIRGILSNAKQQDQKISTKRLSEAKKELIEAEAYGLLEFVETEYTLDNVAGHTAVKKHLRQAVKALNNGRKDVLPMGYLVCGPVGTGKTFMVTCFASEVGIPMVKLKNFRSQWQGVTEGNLEKILGLLKAMAPVAVMIDEADAYLGDRDQSGDSGVSSRVFSQIASFMSDTSNRGEILWFLMTARPDLMPVDLKRQGRAEEHLALFPPHTKEDRIELFEAMKNKSGLQLTEEYVPKLIKKDSNRLSGADMEAALTRAKFRAAAQNSEKVTPEILDAALNDFLPPTYPQEIELQTLSAVIECTSKELLPERYREMDRGEILEKIENLKLRVG